MTQARSETAGKTAAEESFGQAAAACLADVVGPALEQMAQALNARGVAARAQTDGSEARIDIPVGKHARLGHGFGGYPYLRARPDRPTRRMHFERNTSDGRGGNAIGDFPVTEVNAQLVRALVMDLVRVLYGPL